VESAVTGNQLAHRRIVGLAEDDTHGSRRIRHARATRRNLLEPLASQASTEDHLASSTGLVRRQGLGRVPIVIASPTSPHWQKMIIVRSRPGLFHALCKAGPMQRPCAASSAMSSSARATILRCASRLAAEYSVKFSPRRELHFACGPAAHEPLSCIVKQHLILSTPTIVHHYFNGTF